MQSLNRIEMDIKILTALQTLGFNGINSLSELRSYALQMTVPMRIDEIINFMYSKQITDANYLKIPIDIQKLNEAHSFLLGLKEINVIMQTLVAPKVDRKRKNEEIYFKDSIEEDDQRSPKRLKSSPKYDSTLNEWAIAFSELVNKPSGSKLFPTMSFDTTNNHLKQNIFSFFATTKFYNTSHTFINIKGTIYRCLWSTTECCRDTEVEYLEDIKGSLYAVK